MWEKLEEQVTDLIKRSNFKECLTLINEAKKRYPKSQFLEVIDVYVKYKQSPSKFNYDTALGNTYGLNGKALTTDEETLNLLHKFFNELRKYEESLFIYERANAKFPSFELSYLWFDQALKDSNFKQMGKAALQLSRFPKDSTKSSREYYFWNAISTVALFKFQEYRLSSQEKQILPLLTYQNLCKVKPLQSTQEAIVFCLVCEELFPNDESKSAEIIQEIQPQLNSSVDLYLKNFFLKHSKKDDYQIIFDGCTKMLKSLDDYELLKGIVSSGKELGKSKGDLYELIDNCIGTNSRNSRLIRFEIDLTFSENKMITPESLEYYLEKFHNKPCCVSDINHYKTNIDDKVLIEKFTESDEISDPIHDANAFRMNIYKSMDPVEFYNKNKATLENKAKTDYSYCATFIMGMVRDILMNSSSDCPALGDILYVLSFLENYQIKDEHNYDIKCWVIAIYMYLGLTPLAYSYYNDLKIKNVQTDSMDYLIYSRYSTLFPNKQHDYLLKTLPEHDALYDVSLERLPQFISISFDRKAYSKILGMFEFRDKLEKSVGKWTKVVDSINLAHLCNDKRILLMEKIRQSLRVCETTGNMNLSDNRDWSVFGFEDKFNKENLPAVLQYLNINEDWIVMNLAKEFMIEAIPNSEKSVLVASLLEQISKKNENLDSIIDECFTPVEALSFKIFKNLYEDNGSDLINLLNEIHIDKSVIGSWRFNHEYLTHITTLKTLDNFKRIKDKNTRALIKKKLNDIRDSCDDFVQLYKSEITNACKSLQSGKRFDYLESIGYTPLGADGLINSLTEVHKAMRNL